MRPSVSRAVSPADQRRRNRAALAALLTAGLALRVVLAFVVFRGRGFASDLTDFDRWAATLDRVGPGRIYQADPTVNYPPVYLYVLDGLAKASRALAGALGLPAAPVLLYLLKLPAVLCDTALAYVLYRIAAREWDTRAGLLAATAYLAVPVTWYDSAVWGQVDAVPALAAMAALCCLLEHRAELAAVFAALAALTKPQAAVVLVVIVPVLLRRHLTSGPSRTHDRRSWRRLTTAVLAGCATLIALLAPVDIDRFATPPLSEIPVLDKLSGLIGLTSGAARQYPVLTANAYNLWSLVGRPSLASTMHTGTVQWLPDTTTRLAGLPAVTVGTAALLAVALLVILGLLRTDGCVPTLLGYTVITVAFFALPTRVHERYLFPAFAPGAVLCAAATRRLTASAAYAAYGTLSALNLHAVLGAPLHIRSPTPLSSNSPSQPLDLTRHATNVQLPLAWLARAEPTIQVAATTQTLITLALVGLWLTTAAIRPPGRGTRPSRPSQTP